VGLMVTSRREPPEGFRNHRLEHLQTSETTLMLEHELGASLPAVGLEWIQSRTQGNPLFALEFLRYLTRQGFLWSDGKRWNWRAPSNDFVPITVEALIGQLTSSLRGTPQTQAVLEARAILPPELEAEQLNQVWSSVAGLDLRSLERSRIDLERGGLLRGQHFAHPLFGEAIMRELPIERQHQYTRRAIASLEQNNPNLAASLIQNAGLDSTEALNLLLKAAEQVRQTGSTAQVAQVLGLAAELTVGNERVRLALEAERLWLSLGAHHQIVQMARLALNEQPDNREARWRLADANAWLGQADDVEALVNELPKSERHELRWVDARFRAFAQHTASNDALRIWQQHPELAELPRTLTYAVSMFTNMGDSATAERLISQGLDRIDFPPEARMGLTGTLAFIRSDQGRLEEAQALHDQCVEWAEQAGLISPRATSHYNRCFNQYRLGHYEAAIQDLERAIAFYSQAGNAYYSANAQSVLGEILSRLGRFEQAETILLESLDTLSRFGLTHGLANNAWNLSQLYTEWHPPHGGVLALKFARDAVRHSRELNNNRCLTTALAVAARVEAWQGQPSQALVLAYEAREYFSNDDIDDQCQCDFALARSLEANNQPDQALELWSRVAHNTPNAEYQAEAALEVARLKQDDQRGLELFEWFEQRGLGALARRARTYYPQIDATTKPTGMASQASSRIKVLGPIQLEHNGQIVPTRARKRLEIIAYLLEARIAGRSEVGTLDLLDTFYPNETESQGKNTLKQKIYEIRASLGPESVHSTSHGYALGAVSSDAEEFLKNGDSSLWRGVYLEGLGEGWISSVRDALTLALRSKLEALLATDHSELTQPELTQLDTARLGRILCDLEPYDPDVLRLTIRALRASGDDRAAQRFFAEHRTLMLEMNEPIPPTLEAFLIGQA
jgi:tetratricopeptide (TPR) repeat protein/DNA-binding SARP family transcriptional activator